mgnify:CR=1 FL=1
MKSKKTTVMLSVLAAVCLASCSNDEEVNDNDGAVRFTAAIGNQAVATPQSRAAGTVWGAGDKIGIFMVKNGTNDIAESALNKEFTTADGTGNFTPVTGDEIYYPMEGSAVDFISYYPYDADATLDLGIFVEIGTTQTSASQAGFDLLWAKADNAGSGYSKGYAGAVELQFGHCLSKLTMNCKVDASVGVSTLDGATVTIMGMHTRNYFDLKTATLGHSEASLDIVPNKLPTAPTGFDATYDAVIMPDDYKKGIVSVKFEINAETFVWDVGAMKFEAGNEYIYEVLITRTGVQGKGTIAPWSPVNKGGVTAE